MLLILKKVKPIDCNHEIEIEFTDVDGLIESFDDAKRMVDYISTFLNSMRTLCRKTFLQE